MFFSFFVLILCGLISKAESTTGMAPKVVAKKGNLKAADKGTLFDAPIVTMSTLNEKASIMLIDPARTPDAPDDCSFLMKALPAVELDPGATDLVQQESRCDDALFLVKKE